MSNKLRKTLCLIIIPVLAVCILFAVQLFGGLFKRNESDFALAETARAANPKSVADPESSYEIFYGDWPLSPLIYKVKEIKDSSGGDAALTENGTPAVGEYTVTVTAAEGYVFESENEQATFTLKVNPAKLKWTFPSAIREDYTGTMSHEIPYSSQTNKIGEVWATHNSMTYGILEKPVYNYSTANMRVTLNDEPVSKVADSGEYKFTVDGAGNYQNPVFTLTITPKEITFSEVNSLYWRINSATPLGTGTIYENTYKDGGEETKYAYTAHYRTAPPDTSWTDWQYVRTIEADRSIATYYQGYPVTVTLAQSSTATSYFTVEYSGERTASQTGKYVVQGKIIPNKNYSVKINNPAAEDLGVADNGDGTLTVTKTWYLVRNVNRIVSEENELYDFPDGWAIGAFPENGIDLPTLEHGDEVRLYRSTEDEALKAKRKQPAGYTLIVNGEDILYIDDDNMTVRFVDDKLDWKNGEQDVITFTLSRGGEVICTDVSRLKFGYYVNAFMPVGEYSITFTSKLISIRGEHRHWWDGEVKENPGFTYETMTLSYNFSVTEGTLTYDDSVLKSHQSGEGALSFNIAQTQTDFMAFFLFAEEHLITNAVTVETAKASGTYWGKDGVADLYFDSSLLAYRLKRIAGDTYYAPEAEEWRGWLNHVDTFFIYYKIVPIRNFAPPAPSDDSQNYYVLHLYEEVDLPVLESALAYYTGEEYTFKPAGNDARYTVSDNVQSEVGTYYAKFTLVDPVLHRWKGVEGAVYEVPYEILPAQGGQEGDDNPQTPPDKPDPPESGDNDGSGGKNVKTVVIVLVVVYGVLMCAAAAVIVYLVRRIKKKRGGAPDGGQPEEAEPADSAAQSEGAQPADSAATPANDESAVGENPADGKTE